MTMNDSWGYHKADDDWKSPKTVVRNLIQCARDGGNYLLNIGPKPDGSIPEESVRIQTAVGIRDRANAGYGEHPQKPAATPGRSLSKPG
jgi:alpha-L-fucosidase